MARDLIEGKYPLSPSVRDKIFACTLCANCSEQCQQLISDHHQEIFEALREECIDAGLGLPQHLSIAANEQSVHNPYGDKEDQRFLDIESKYFKEHADVLFFVGCTTALRNKLFFKDILSILDHFAVDFTLSKDEWCCGSPLLTTGQKKVARELAQHNADIIAKIHPKIIITACAGCYRTLKRQYSEKFGLLKDNSIHILHLSEYLSQLMKKQTFRKDIPKIAVTYHDPCHLGRHVGVYDSPRLVLKALPNIQFLEMPRNRQNAWCCGAGAGVKSAFKEWSVEISEDRVKEALNLNTKAKYPLKFLVSTCPFCERNLSDALDNLKKQNYPGASHLEVIDLLQLVKQYL
jgi:Fe-S oxidoreductase